LPGWPVNRDRFPTRRFWIGLGLGLGLGLRLGLGLQFTKTAVAGKFAIGAEEPRDGNFSHLATVAPHRQRYATVATSIELG
jgi:hypothetical protein